MNRRGWWQANLFAGFLESGVGLCSLRQVFTPCIGETTLLPPCNPDPPLLQSYRVSTSFISINYKERLLS
jgi:hypothetical protein